MAALPSVPILPSLQLILELPTTLRSHHSVYLVTAHGGAVADGACQPGRSYPASPMARAISSSERITCAPQEIMTVQHPIFKLI